MKDGIIRSVRGPGGGFVLKKLPEEINTWDVFCTVDNSNKLYDYCSIKGEHECDLIHNCKIKFVWQQIDSTLKDTMEKITLRDIIKS
jgi:Rrf2 family iron-sulfur cluster assembly transcriptional regulator